MAETVALPVPGYPSDLEREVILRDGARLRLRPIRPADQPRLVEFYAELSQETAYQRFFTVMKRLPPDWARLLATVDYRRRLALIVENETVDPPDLVAVARYEPTSSPDMVEVAIVVRDDWQNRGLGAILLGALLDAAEGRGSRYFQAYVLATNRRMLDMLARFTAIKTQHMESGVTELVFTRRGASPPAAGGHAVSTPRAAPGRRR